MYAKNFESMRLVCVRHHGYLHANWPWKGLAADLDCIKHGEHPNNLKSGVMPGALVEFPRYRGQLLVDPIIITRALFPQFSLQYRQNWPSLVKTFWGPAIVNLTL